MAPPPSRSDKKSSDPSTPPAAQAGDATEAASADKKQQTPSDLLLSGRMTWVLVLLTLFIVVPLSPLGSLITKRPPRSAHRSQWQAGAEATIHITVTTADYDKLACAGAEQFGAARCAYQSEGQLFPRDPNQPLDDNKENIIQPYRTTDNQLILLSGLWAQPEIAMRLHNEPSRGVLEKKLARFVATCQVRFLREWDSPLIRWSPRDSWSNQGKAMVAEPLSCSIMQEKHP